jgi:hypothetical protein
LVLEKFVKDRILVIMNKPPPPASHLQPLVPPALGALLEEEIRLAESDGTMGRSDDLLLEGGGRRFLIHLLKEGTTPAIRRAMQKIRTPGSPADPGPVPLLVVPYMGEVGSRVCLDAGLSWMDLSGNAHIRSHGLLIRTEGRPNRFLKRGRPSSLFAAQSSRLPRWLLTHPGEAFTQASLAASLGLDRGLLSRLLKRMREEGFVTLDPQGRIQVADPALLLEAWREGYHLQTKVWRRFHLPARSGEELQTQVVKAFASRTLPYALTGLAAAWAYTRFAAFRLVSLYVPTLEGEDLLRRLGGEETERGANLWLMVPKDEGTLHLVRDLEGVSVVSPLQAFLDLKDHPERASEAAEALRSEFLPWSRRG